VLALIFATLFVVEGLLLARFWLQMAAANASDGLTALVMDASRPLIAPCTGGAVETREVGWFDCRTLIAALAYLGAGAGVAAVVGALTLVFSAGRAVTRPRRRAHLHLNQTRSERASGRLLDIVSLGMKPSQASRALTMLNLERLHADLHVIPTADGCIIAAFARAHPASRLPVIGSLQSARNTIAVHRAFRAIERRFAPEAAPVQLPEVQSSRVPAGAHR